MLRFDKVERCFDIVACVDGALVVYPPTSSRPRYRKRWAPHLRSFRSNLRRHLLYLYPVGGRNIALSVSVSVLSHHTSTSRSRRRQTPRTKHITGLDETWRRYDFGPFVTSSTKPEVHNILHWHQRRTAPWLQVNCTENVVKFGRVVFTICKCTDKRKDKPTEGEL